MKAAILLGAMIFLTGCAIGTRQPIYDPAKDTILDPRLAGTWYSPDLVYEIVQWRSGFWMREVKPGCAEQQEPQPWPVDLVRMEKQEYLFLAFPPFAQTHGIGTLLFPCWRVTFDDRNTLRLALLNSIALNKFLQDHPGTMRYEPVRGGHGTFAMAIGPATQPGEPATAPTTPATTPTTHLSGEIEINNIILTDEPKRIRHFLSDHANDPELFCQPIVLRRVTGS